MSETALALPASAGMLRQVLTDAVLLGEWHAELLTMAQRIVGMRVVG